jgi:two-component system, chemotaxis family, protein-glutamate methylesterase/glutaminase
MDSGGNRTRAVVPPPDRIVVIGASTGGTAALRVLLVALPADGPGMVVVLHTPEEFVAGFAARLASQCALEVREAVDGDEVCRGRVLFAPAGRHVELARVGARFQLVLRDGPSVCQHRPSIDVLFQSVAACAGANAVGVILTGMGEDGARGLRAMKDRGAVTIAQDEASCVVFDMPRAAIRLGGVDHVLPLAGIAAGIARVCR